MVTIRDVAKKAGVSLGTVSNVINGIPSVSEENRERVNRAIAELGYRRNNAASQLRSNKSNTIGLIIPDITNPFYPELMRGVDDAARKEGYNVFLCNKDRSTAAEEQAIEALLSKNVDGIIIFKPKINGEKITEIMEICSLLIMDADPGTVGCDVINVDDYSGMFQSVREVIDRGHSRIAFISGLDGSVSSKRRQQAFVDAVRHFGLDEREDYRSNGALTFDSGMQIFRKFLALDPPPTVILTANDQMARGAMFMAQSLGMQIPGDISIVGYDDIYDAKWSNPPLTTTWHPKYELGFTGAEQLLDQIRRRQDHQEFRRWVRSMETVFCSRGSLGAPRG